MTSISTNGNTTLSLTYHCNCAKSYTPKSQRPPLPETQPQNITESTTLISKPQNIKIPGSPAPRTTSPHPTKFPSLQLHARLRHSDLFRKMEMSNCLVPPLWQVTELPVASPPWAIKVRRDSAVLSLEVEGIEGPGGGRTRFWGAIWVPLDPSMDAPGRMQLVRGWVGAKVDSPHAFNCAPAAAAIHVGEISGI